MVTVVVDQVMLHKFKFLITNHHKINLLHMSSQGNLHYISTREPSGMPNSFLRGFTDPGEINKTNLQTALDTHRMATFVLNQKRRSIPE